METRTYIPQATSIVYKPVGWPVVNMRLARAEGDAFDGGYATGERWITSARFGWTVHVAAVDDLVTATVTLVAVSRASQLLWRISAANEAAKQSGGPVATGPFVMFDPATREQLTIANAILSTVPRVGLGEGNPARAFAWSGAGSVEIVPG